MNKRLIGTAVCWALTASVVLLSGCGILVTTRDAGPLTTKEFDLKDFDVVEIGSAFRFDISRSDSYKVEVTANENAFKHIRVDTAGKTLRVGTDWVPLSFGNRPLEAKITMPELVRLDVSGASRGIAKGFVSDNQTTTHVSGASTLEIEMEAKEFSGTLSGSSEVNATVRSSASRFDLSGASRIRLDSQTGDFRFKASGASTGTGNVKASSTSIDLMGSSDIRISGSGGDLKLTGSGASGANLGSFSVRDCDINLSGASDGQIDVGGRLDVTLSGASKLTYTGNPMLGARMDVTGGSKLERK